MKKFDFDLVLYHANCTDGFCSAWIAHQHCLNAEFIPVQYGQPAPDVTGRTVLIADFSYKRPAMTQILLDAKQVVVLDHHKTARQELLGLHGIKDSIVLFDMDRSGAGMTWDYFNPDKPRPTIVQYVEDRDLWRHSLPDCHEYTAALRSYPQDFGTWNGLEMVTPHTHHWVNFINEGAAILRSQKLIVDQHVSHARPCKLAGVTGAAVNATVFFSEIAGKLAEGRPFGAAYFDRDDGKRQWSLRSTEDGIDVSELATQFEGGGHARAAGFEQALTGDLAHPGAPV